MNKTESVLVELPGDRLYDDDCQVTTLTLSDASALSLLPKTQDTKKVFQIIDKHINFDVKKLTLPDFWFLLYWQRINSYPSFPIKLPWKCPHCDTKNIDELSGSKLVIEDLAKEYDATSIDEGIQVDFPSAGELSIRIKLAGDELEVQNYLRKNKNLQATPELYEELMIACMFEPNGGTLAERHEMVISMVAEDHMLIKSFEEMFDFGVQSYSEFTCHGCKEVSKVSFEFNLTNFFPSVSDTQDLRTRILPRKRAKSASKHDSRNGSSEGSICSEDSRQLRENAETIEGSEKSADESQTKIEMTPEELQAMIEQEVAKVKNSATAVDENVDFDSIKER